MSEAWAFDEVYKIGENDWGYWFGIGLLKDRWTGFAVGTWKDDKGEHQMMFFFPEIADDLVMGKTDRDLVIKLTGAIAQSVEHAYGGVSRWFVPEDLRGKPEDFICEVCSSVGCDKERHDFADAW